MATHDFECRECGEVFEENVPYGSDVGPCPACGATDAERLWAPPALTPASSLGVTGAAAKDSDIRRSEREHARQERLRDIKKQRAAGELVSEPQKKKR